MNNNRNVNIIDYNEIHTLPELTPNQDGLVIAMLVMSDFTHLGHMEIVSQALRIADKVYIVFGSIQNKGTEKSPYNYKQRVDKVKIVFGNSDKIKFLGIADIDAKYPEDWEAHVLEKIRKHFNGVMPTDYFGGSEYDVSWYGHTKIPENNDQPMRIHVFNRRSSYFMSGTEVRAGIANGHDEWEQHVPRCLIKYLKDNFPKELTLKYRVEEKKKVNKDSEFNN